MASRTLYPPLIESYLPAFKASGGLKLKFSLSKYSTVDATAIKSIHVTVTKQSTGMSVVNKNDAGNRFRKTKIIIINSGLKPSSEDGNLYEVDINNDDIEGGWTPGWIYKIQVRLSTVAYSSTDANGKIVGQSDWLAVNANYFSEWSTVCVVKAIGENRILIPVLNGYDSSINQNNANADKIYSVSTNTIDFIGYYSNVNANNIQLDEYLYSYRIRLLDSLGIKTYEDSGIIYTDKYDNLNTFSYLIKYALEAGQRYKIIFDYVTNNNYTETLTFNIESISVYESTINFSVRTVETHPTLSEVTSVHMEEEEGRIALKLYSDLNEMYEGAICIRRSDSRDNFRTWSDLAIITIKNEYVNDMPVFYDYIVESGISYKYGLETINKAGLRGLLTETSTLVRRIFNYSYLLGENNQQLKLMFNNVINSYNYTVNESKTDTIGGKYPYITRTGGTKYRTFPISGLISFNMDENHLFINKDFLYEYKSNDLINQYDLTYEREFREKVLEFLYDGKPKLFKSPTEGNIIVRLMNVSATPEQSLNRLIYNFSATAYELDEPTMDNYKSYHFYECDPDTVDFNFNIIKTRAAQLNITNPGSANIIDLIKSNFDKANVLGYKEEVYSLSNITLTFNSMPTRAVINGNEYLGNMFIYNGSPHVILDQGGSPYRTYTFDENITMHAGTDILQIPPLDANNIMGQEYDSDNPIEVTVDFIYNAISTNLDNRVVTEKTVIRGIGQYHGPMAPSETIYRNIYEKYFCEWGDFFRKVDHLTCVDIEADPGTVFLLQDETDKVEGEYHTINSTGYLNFSDLNNIKDLQYIGRRNSKGAIITVESEELTLAKELLDKAKKNSYIAQTSINILKEANNGAYKSLLANYSSSLSQEQKISMFEDVVAAIDENEFSDEELRTDVIINYTYVLVEGRYDS